MYALLASRSASLSALAAGGRTGVGAGVGSDLGGAAEVLSSIGGAKRDGGGMAVARGPGHLAGDDASCGAADRGRHSLATSLTAAVVSMRAMVSRCLFASGQLPARWNECAF